jgi:hypothetical protein
MDKEKLRTKKQVRATLLESFAPSAQREFFGGGDDE